MRHSALFDRTGRQPGVLWAASGRARPPLRAASDKARLVPLSAALVDEHHRGRALRAPTLASSKIAALKSPSAARAGFSQISSARFLNVGWFSPRPPGAGVVVRNPPAKTAGLHDVAEVLALRGRCYADYGNR